MHAVTGVTAADTYAMPEILSFVFRIVGHLRGKNNRIRAHRRLGDRAMARQAWLDAAKHYGRVLRIKSIPTILVQYGHALKEAGALDEAESAYARVPTNVPDALEANFHRAEILARLGRRAEAIELYTSVLGVVPDHRGAFAGLLHLDARDAMPETFLRWAVPDASIALASGVERLRHQFEQWADLAIHPVSTYNQFRQSHPVLAAPQASHAPAIQIIVDARDFGPTFLRATVLSLVDQADGNWTAVILATDVIIEHSVASLANVDTRIAFTTDIDLIELKSHLLLQMSAGTILSPSAIGWFRYVIERTGSAACWCDHDHAVEAWNGTLYYSEPRLWGVFDADMIAQTASPPIAVLIDRSRLRSPAFKLPAQEWRRAALLGVIGAKENTAHIPRVLATALRLSERSAGAPNIMDPIALWSIEPASAPPREGRVSSVSGLSIKTRAGRPAVSVSVDINRTATLQIIIQTRDAADMLREAIESLFDQAADPARIQLTIVDNRSQNVSTLRYLAELERQLGATILHLDEPFNWARANNLAAGKSASDHVLFANNDITMMTPGWDSLLRGYLDRADTGAVGARLLYPDGTIQHAGVLFGIGDGGPLHDGARCEADNTGQLDRLNLTRTVAAVTGAFLATRRDLFTRVGGFDALRFPVAYNDIDYCLAVRETGARILYAPAIELVHHESKTRGLNVGRGRVSWDLAEFTSLRQKWPRDCEHEPGMNIQWSTNRPFEGFREPGMRAIIASIDRSAVTNPWLTDRNASLA